MRENNLKNQIVYIVGGQRKRSRPGCVCGVVWCVWWGLMDALFGPNVIHFIKKLKRKYKGTKNVKMFVTVTLRCTRESVSWSMPRRLSRRISGCAGSNPASRIFFVLVV